MGVFCHLYLPEILLMRAGDIETNPGPNMPQGSVSEWELLKLSELIGPSDYYKVGMSLEIPYAQLEGIMKQQLNNKTNALLAVFITWNHQQDTSINKREVLAEKLRKGGLGELSDQLLNGKLDENSTAGPSRTLQSQSEPLSPALIERCRNDFKFKYRSTLCKIRSDPLNPNSFVEFMYMYTNLVLKREEQRGQRLELKPLSYSELLNFIAGGDFPRRMLVQGEAGAGKTTLCAKIAWDWINEKSFKEFVWVLIVPLRESKRYTLGEIAKSYLTKSNPTTSSQLTHYIRSNSDKIFIACDGLDEFSSKIEQLEENVPTECPLPQSSQSTSGSSLPRVDNSGACDNLEQSDEIDVGDILCSEQLETCPVLVTSRPWRAKDIRSNGVLSRLYTFIHLEGFSEDDLSDYIHKSFPENDARANRLIKLTKKSDIISQSIVHYPVYVAMLCVMWKEITERGLEELESFQTFSQVFRHIFVFLKEYYARKKIKNVGSTSLMDRLKEINDLLEPVTNVALSGLLRDEIKLVFHKGDFQDCSESMETACRVGILSQEDRIRSLLDSRESNLPVLETRVFFPHKLFQEYMAGMSLASMCRSDPSEFERLMNQVVLPRCEEFRYLLYFVASQGEEVGRKVIECMAQGLNERTNLLVDVAFESNHPEAVAVMHDRFPPEEQAIVIDSGNISHTIAAYKSIGKDTCDITIADCPPTDVGNIASIVRSSPSIMSLFMIGFSQGFNILKEQAANFEVPMVHFASIYTFTCSDSRDLAEAVCSMPNLQDLTLNDVFVGDEFYSTLKDNALDLKIKTLVILSTAEDDKDFWSEGFIPLLDSDEVAHDLAEALSSMPELADLRLEFFPLDTLIKKIRQRVLSFENCFPQIAKGNFSFNQEPQNDMQSFLHTLERLQSESEKRERPVNLEDDIESDGSMENLSPDEQDVHADDGGDDGDDSEDDPQVDTLLTDQHLPSVSVAKEAQATSTELQGMYMHDHYPEETGRPCPHHSEAVHDGTLKRKAPSTDTSEVPEKHPRDGAC